MVVQPPVFPCRNYVLIDRTERIEVDMSLSVDAEDIDPQISPSRPIDVHHHLPEEEIALGPACWLWDYVGFRLYASCS